jgi:hypothetical protein
MSATEQAMKIEPGRAKASPGRAVIPGLLVAIPALLFYGIAFRNLVNLPLLDDYDSLLGFLNQLVKVKGTWARLWFFLGAQHNEYKIFFGHGIAWAQYAALGHVNFAAICVAGDCAVAALAVILWSMFLPGEKDIGRRLTYFVPVAWLIFQLEYWETVNWAMPSLQNLWVIVFSFGAIQCLFQSTRRAYAGALALYALAVAASGNGFFLLPVGLLILVIRRQRARAAGWLGMSAVCIAAYAFRYNIHSSQAIYAAQSQQHGSVFATLKHLRPDYVLAFLGNAAAIGGASTTSAAISIALGLVLLAFFVWMARRGYAKKNPAIAYCVLFLLLTALGVAGLRSDLGLTQSLSSRYTIYGALAVIFAWTALAEEFLQQRSGPILNNNPYVAMTGLAILFGLCTDNVGNANLSKRKSDAMIGMAAFKCTMGSAVPESPIAPAPRENEVIRTLRQRSRVILTDSVRLGVFEPPASLGCPE